MSKPVTNSRIWTGYGARALRELRDAVATAKQSDPMAPVTVIVPNNVAGIVARRFLAAGVGDRPGVAGIEFSTLLRLAERHALSTLGSRRPTTHMVLSAAWRSALSREPGLFSGVAEHSATVRALARAHRELRELDQEALAAVAGTNGVTEDLVRLHEQVVRDLRDGWYDTVDALRIATDDPPALGTLIRYLPQPATPAEERFAAALAGANQVVDIVALTGATRADAAVLRALGVAAPAETSRPATATRVIDAADADDEIRVVIRDLVHALRTIPAHRIAVLHTSSSGYPRLLHEQLAAAGIRANGPGVRPVDERALPRTLLELLALAERDVPRSDLFRALATAPARDFTGEMIPLSRWERMSRRAGIVSGDDWDNRIAAFLDDRRAAADSERVRTDEEPSEARLRQIEFDIAEANAMAAFVRRLRSEFAAGAALTTWAELSGWCSDLLETLLGSDSPRRLPPEEQYALVAVRSALSGLAALDGVDTPPTLEMLREVLAAELAATLPRVGRFSEGVLVAPLSAAIGLDLDIVYVVGCSEDLLPGRLHADGLLPDAARDRSTGALRDRRTRLDDDHRHFLAALAAARTAVVSFPRGDLRRSTRRLPSRFLLLSLQKLSGNPMLTVSEWDRHDRSGTTNVSASSFAAGVLTTEAPATDQEWNMRQVVATRSLDDAAYQSGVAMTVARIGDAFTRFDGNLIGVLGLPDPTDSDRVIAPTTLEGYARCPHSYFVQRVLGVRPVEQPEDVVQISPLEIGNIIHDSVHRFIDGLADLPGSGVPWSEEHLQRLLDIGAEEADRAEQRGLTGHHRLWERERDRIRNDLERLLNDDSAWRADNDASVLASEMPFGMRGSAPITIPLGEGRLLRMKGSADLVHRGADGTLHVIDIKTGSSTKFKGIGSDDPTVGGTKLQLPTYAHAARIRYGAVDTPVQASYWFVRKGGTRIPLALSDAVESEYRRVVGILARSIGSGLYPHRPAKTPSYGWVDCAYCDPDGIGHAEKRRIWETKRHADELNELVALLEPASGEAQS